MSATSTLCELRDKLRALEPLSRDWTPDGMPSFLLRRELRGLEERLVMDHVIDALLRPEIRSLLVRAAADDPARVIYSEIGALLDRHGLLQGLWGLLLDLEQEARQGRSGSARRTETARRDARRRLEANIMHLRRMLRQAPISVGRQICDRKDVSRGTKEHVSSFRSARRS